MATNQHTDIFAPPSEEELQRVTTKSAKQPQDSDAGSDMFAPPTKEELAQHASAPQDDMFAPPKPHELAGKPAPVPELLPDSYFQELAKKQGVDPDELKSLAPYFGATAETHGVGDTLGQAGKFAVGSLGRTLGNIPQKIAIELQDNPGMRDALEDLRETGRKQANPITSIGEQIASPFANVGAGAGLAGRLATAAGMGAVSGAAESKHGHELEEAAKGGAAGLAVGAGIEGIGAGIAGLAKMRTSKALDAAPVSQQVHIGSATEAERGLHQDADKIVEDFIMRGNMPEEASKVDKLLERNYDKHDLENILDPTTTEGHLFREKMQPKLESSASQDAAAAAEPLHISVDEVKQALAHDVADARLKQFAEDLTGQAPKNTQEARQLVNQWGSGQGGLDAIKNKYELFTEKQAANRAIRNNDMEVQGTGNATEKFGNYLSDRQYVLQHLDDRAGTKTNTILRDINENSNKMSQALAPLREREQQIFRNAKKTGVDSELVNNETNRVYDALDSGDLSKLSPAETKSAEEIREYFDTTRQFANEGVSKLHPEIAPLSVGDARNVAGEPSGYVPKQLTDTPTIINRLQERIAAAEEQVGKLSELRRGTPEWKAATQDPNVQDLLHASGLFNGNEVTSGQELTNKLSEMMYSKAGQQALETRARSAMQRSGDGGIPDFLLEKNLYKLMRKYSDNTLKHVYLRQPIDRLALEAHKLEKLGDLTGAKYVRDTITGAMGGVRSGTLSAQWQHMNTQASAKLIEMANRVGKDTVRGQILMFTKQLPDLLLSLNHQIYPNALGWSPHAVIQNLTQSVAKLAPELGGRYGYTTLAQVAPKTALNIAKYTAEAQRLGMIPAEMSRNGQQALKEGIRRGALWNMTDATVEAAGKIGMAAFQKSEEFNRALVVSVADKMSKDLAAGNGAAMASLSRFPQDIRNTILRDPGHIRDNYELLAKYLNSTTMYNYNKASMSELGQTLGPLFSTFSKWPTATAGDIIHNVRSLGLTGSIPRNVEKYLAPFMLLAAAQRLTLGAPDEMSDMKKKLVGKEGLSGMAPIGTVKGLLTGEVFTPPILRTVGSALKPAATGNTEGLKSGISSIAKSYAPGAGIFKFFTEDMLKYLDSADKQLKGKK